MLRHRHDSYFFIRFCITMANIVNFSIWCVLLSKKVGGLLIYAQHYPKSSLGRICKNLLLLGAFRFL